MSGKGPWRLSATSGVQRALSIEYLTGEGLLNLAERWESLASLRRNPSEPFASFVTFAVVNLSVHRSERRGKMTTAKDTQYTKVQATDSMIKSSNAPTVGDSGAAAKNTMANHRQATIRPDHPMQFTPKSYQTAITSATFVAHVDHRLIATARKKATGGHGGNRGEWSSVSVRSATSCSIPPRTSRAPIRPRSYFHAQNG
jgi:hypothetical protein